MGHLGFFFFFSLLHVNALLSDAGHVLREAEEFSGGKNKERVVVGGHLQARPSRACPWSRARQEALKSHCSRVEEAREAPGREGRGGGGRGGGGSGGWRKEDIGQFLKLHFSVKCLNICVHRSVFMLANPYWVMIYVTSQ